MAAAITSLREARRIIAERAAETLWTRGGDAFTVEELDAIIERKRAAANYKHPLRAPAYWSLLLVALGAGAIGAAWTGLETFFGWFFVGGLCLALPCAALLADYFELPLAEQDEDLKLALLLRQELPGEATQMQRALTLLENGRPFILYLRTFAVETRALSESDVNRKRGQAWDTIKQLPTLPDPESVASLRQDYFLRKSILEQAHRLHADWLIHREVLRAVGAAAPAVCFGNIFLGSDKREEVEKLGVMEVTIVSTEWWPVFERFASRAAAVVVYLETLTTSIARELKHLTVSQHPLIVVSKWSLDGSFDDREVLSAVQNNPNARGVLISSSDVSPLSQALADVIRPSSEKTPL